MRGHAALVGLLGVLTLVVLRAPGADAVSVTVDGATGVDEPGCGTAADGCASLTFAIATEAGESPVDVALRGSVVANATIVVPAGWQVTLEGGSVVADLPANASLFSVQSGASLSVATEALTSSSSVGPLVDASADASVMLADARVEWGSAAIVTAAAAAARAVVVRNCSSRTSAELFVGAALLLDVSDTRAEVTGSAVPLLRVTGDGGNISVSRVALNATGEVLHVEGAAVSGDISLRDVVGRGARAAFVGGDSVVHGNVSLTRVTVTDGAGEDGIWLFVQFARILGDVTGSELTAADFFSANKGGVAIEESVVNGSVALTGLDIARVDLLRGSCLGMWRVYGVDSVRVADAVLAGVHSDSTLLGGCIYASTVAPSGDLTVTNVSVSDFTGTQGAVVYLASVEVLYGTMEYSSLRVADSNIATRCGAIRWSYAKTASLLVADVLVESSYVADKGGVLYLYDSRIYGPDCVLTNIVVRDSEVVGDGGIMYTYLTRFSARQALLMNWRVERSTVRYGGMWYLEQGAISSYVTVGNASVSDSIFGAGGILYLYFPTLYGSFNITDPSITDSVATSVAGILRMYGFYSRDAAPVVIQGARISRVSGFSRDAIAAFYAGADVTDREIIIDDVALTDVEAGGTAAVRVDNSEWAGFRFSNIRLTNVTFGLVFLYSSASLATLSFDGIDASGHVAGAVLAMTDDASAATVSVRNVRLAPTGSEVDGAFSFSLGHADTVTFDNCTFGSGSPPALFLDGLSELGAVTMTNVVHSADSGLVDATGTSSVQSLTVADSEGQFVLHADRGVIEHVSVTSFTAVGVGDLFLLEQSQVSVMQLERLGGSAAMGNVIVSTTATSALDVLSIRDCDAVGGIDTPVLTFLASNCGFFAPVTVSQTTLVNVSASTVVGHDLTVSGSVVYLSDVNVTDAVRVASDDGDAAVFADAALAATVAVEAAGSANVTASRGSAFSVMCSSLGPTAVFLTDGSACPVDVWASGVHAAVDLQTGATTTLSVTSGSSAALTARNTELARGGLVSNTFDDVVTVTASDVSVTGDVSSVASLHCMRCAFRGASVVVGGEARIERSTVTANSTIVAAVVRMTDSVVGDNVDPVQATARAVLRNCTFRDNHRAVNVAAPASCADVDVVGCTFEDSNWAEFAPAVWYEGTFACPGLMSNNSLAAGQRVSTAPMSINVSTTALVAASGGVLPELRVFMVDAFGASLAGVAGDLTVYLTLADEDERDEYAIAGQTVAFGEASEGVFVDVSPRGLVGGSFVMHVNPLHFDAADAVAVSVTLLDCAVGQQLSASGQLCETCAPTTVSLRAGDACQGCPAGGHCAGGRALISQRGYWRSSNASSAFYACLTADSCLAGDRCRRGHEGHLCDVCAPGFAKTPTEECERCVTDSTAAVVALLAVSAVAVVVAAALMVRSSLAARPRAGTVSTLKILLNFMTMLGLLRHMGVQWGAAVTAFLTWMSVFSGGSLSSVYVLQCAVDVPVLTEFWLYFAAPGFIVAGAGAAVAALSRGWRRAICGQPPLFVWSQAVLVLGYFAYAPIMMAAFEALTCVELDDGRRWLARDTSVECSGGEYGAVHAVALFYSTAVLLGWPAFIVRLVPTHGAGENNPQLVRRTFFFTNEFKRRFFYWEGIVMLRKALFAAVTVALSTETVDVQVYTATWLSLSAFLLQTYATPHRRRRQALAETAAQAAIAVSLLLGQGINADGIGQAGRSLCRTLLVIVNSVVLAGLLFLIGAFVIEGIRDRARDRKSPSPSPSPSQVQATPSSPAPSGPAPSQVQATPSSPNTSQDQKVQKSSRVTLPPLSPSSRVAPAATTEDATRPPEPAEPS